MSRLQSKTTTLVSSASDSQVVPEKNEQIRLKRSYRIDSIDCLRGWVMALMTLDHVRAYFANDLHDFIEDPNLPLVFITRWITHLCAPIFVLLAGVSIGLMAIRKAPADISRFLLKRGLWLLFLEATLISFAWEFNGQNNPYTLTFQVIWALAVAMLAMSVLIHLPKKLLAAIALCLIGSGEFIDPLFPATVWTEALPLWVSLHRPMVWDVNGVWIAVVYPILSWVGVMAAGYLLAHWLSGAGADRAKRLNLLGAGLLIGFVGLRLFTAFGEPLPWKHGETWIYSLLSFIQVSKYPPSVLYLCLTIGIGLLLWGLFERYKTPLNSAMTTIGRVPLFFYVLHLYLIHFGVLVVGYCMGFSIEALAVNFFMLPSEFSFPLAVSYGIWLLVMAVMYPLCVWFANVKARRKDWWLSYL